MHWFLILQSAKEILNTGRKFRILNSNSQACHDYHFFIISGTSGSVSGKTLEPGHYITGQSPHTNESRRGAFRWCSSSVMLVLNSFPSSLRGHNWHRGHYSRTARRWALFWDWVPLFGITAKNRTIWRLMTFSPRHPMQGQTQVLIPLDLPAFGCFSPVFLSPDSRSQSWVSYFA